MKPDAEKGDAVSESEGDYDWQGEQEYLRCPECSTFINPEVVDDGSGCTDTVKCPKCKTAFEYSVHTRYDTRLLSPDEIAEEGGIDEIHDGRET